MQPQNLLLSNELTLCRREEIHTSIIVSLWPRESLDTNFMRGRWEDSEERLDDVSE